MGANALSRIMGRTGIVLIFIVSPVFATEAANAAAPPSIIAYAAAGSPGDLVAALEETVAVSLEGIGEIPYMPGIVQMVVGMGSPLPLSAWNNKGEIHVLVAGEEARTPVIAGVVSGDGLERVARALDAREGFFEEEGVTFLAARLAGLGPVVMSELSGGRILITAKTGDALRLRDILADGGLPAAPGGGAAFRLDVAKAGEIYGGLLDLALMLARSRIFDMGEVLANIEKERGELDTPEELADLDRIRLVVEGWERAGDLFVESAKALVGSLAVVGVDVDFRGGRLRLTSSLSGRENTVLGRAIAAAEKRPNPDLPYAGMVAGDAVLYSYTTVYDDTLNTAVMAFVKTALDTILGEALPEAAAIVDSLDRSVGEVGVRDYAGAMYLAPAGDLVQDTYLRCDKPETVMPGIEKLSAAFMSAQESIIRVAARYLAKNMRATGGTDSGVDDVWLRDLERGGMGAALEPVLDRGEHGGLPYMRVTMKGDFEKYIPPSLRDDAEAAEQLDVLRIVLERLDALVMRSGEFVAVSSGGAGGVLEERLARLAAVFARRDSSFERYAAANADASLPRQNGFAMVRAAEFIGAIALNAINQALPGLKDAALEIARSVDGEDAFVLAYAGARDGAFVSTLDVPARAVNVVLKNYFRLAGAFSSLYEDEHDGEYQFDGDDAGDGSDAPGDVQ